MSAIEEITEEAQQGIAGNELSSLKKPVSPEQFHSALRTRLCDGS